MGFAVYAASDCGNQRIQFCAKLLTAARLGLQRDPHVRTRAILARRDVEPDRLRGAPIESRRGLARG
jgi:hypothetical protein